MKNDSYFQKQEELEVEFLLENMWVKA